MKRHNTPDWGIWIILSISFLLYARVFFLRPDVWWDSSVYVGMGKYLYSLGGVGFLEVSRPLVWPLLLGFLWFFQVPVIIGGKILVMLFALGTIYLTYRIGCSLAHRSVGLLSALFVAFFPTFFLFTGVLHTEIPALFFSLLGIYLIIQKRYSLAGLFVGLGVMTRFFQVLILVPVLIYLVLNTTKIMRKEVIRFLVWFSIPLFFFFLSSFFLYGIPFEPFVMQAWMSSHTGWIFTKGFSYYFIELFRQNAFFLFSLVGIWFVFRKKHPEGIFLGLLWVFSFIPYLFVAHKEARFLISSLPFFALLASYGLWMLLSRYKKVQRFLLLGVGVLWIFLVMGQLSWNSYHDGFDVFREYVRSSEGVFWISNPGFVVHEDFFVEELMYYPLFSSSKITGLMARLEEADHILINTCDVLPCRLDDSGCAEQAALLFSTIETGFEKVYGDQEGVCRHGIYRSD